MTFKEFLTADWWIGVQGIAATIALIAVAIAAIDFAIRLNTTRVNAVSFHVEKSPSTHFGRDTNEMIRCTISARPMGPTVWYEPEWQIFGITRHLEYEVPPIMTANDETTITLSIPYEQLASVWVGIAWVEPRMLGSRSRGSRVHLLESRYQRWETYLWYWWPRKKAARWIEPSGKPNRLLEPPSD